MSPQLGSLEKALRMGEGRRLKRLQEQAAYIATLEPDFEKLSDEALAGKTAEFRQRLENGEPLDELVFEAFAAVREAGKRALGQRIFDVQGEEIELSSHDGERKLVVDGAQVFGSIPELERLGEARHDSYVLRAERLDGDLWEVKVTPL